MTQQEIEELRINAEAMSLMETLCDDTACKKVLLG